MDVIDVRKQKEELEGVLHTLFQQFQQRTGLAVEGVDINSIQIFEVSAEGSRSIVQGVRVYLESL